MRKVSYLLALIYVFVFNTSNDFVYAQHPIWPQPGAEWEICKARPLVIAPTVYDVSPPIRYEKDTLIDNKTYQITRKLKPNGKIMIEFFTRFNQDTIFRYVNGNEYMFFTYNVSVGDTLFPLRTGIDDYDKDTCSSTLELLCLDISTINIDGNNLKLYEFNNVGNVENNPYSYLKYYWIEIIGWVSRFPWLIISEEGYCNYFYADADFEFPIYYTDSTRSLPIKFQQHGHVCDTLLSTEKKHVEYISIYPNPSSSEITIDGLPQDNYNFQVSDNLGRVVMKGKLTNNKIDISRLKSGVYMLKIARENELFYTTKIIKE